MVKEISSITSSKNETLNSLLYKFFLERKLYLSGHKIPATALVQRYMSIIQLNIQVFALLSPIYRSFHDHLRHFGPDTTLKQYSIPTNI